jgi:hypothetical protein
MKYTFTHKSLELFLRYNTQHNAHNIVQGHITNTLVAADEFGRNPELLVACPGRGLTPWFTVPEGFYALVTSNGAEINDPETNSCVWGAG